MRRKGRPHRPHIVTSTSDTAPKRPRRRPSVEERIVIIEAKEAERDQRLAAIEAKSDREAPRDR